ncbi:MAG: NAD-dependent epimerase/dehydratase family protein [Dehalococcoidia bacterium]|nr:NAD-dependent epimerase/dehydratase family protein [Dehalococcoidia bacterium]
MKKVVVTGGAGFIGSHLTAELAVQGYVVVVLDDFSTASDEKIASLRQKENVELAQGSITDLPRLQKLFEGIDYVFHQAAMARVPRSIEDPLTVNQVNITGTLNVLLAARDNSVKKVVFASSSSVYGDTSVLPQREDLIANPLSPYALTKLAGEYYCTIFTQLYGLSTVCLRYFNVYGPGQDPHSQYAMVIPAFIDRVARNLPPVIHGDGEQSRDFTFIQDVVHANILAAKSTAEGIYNIGSGRSITINQLAEKIIKLMQKDLKPIHEKGRLGDVKHALADITRARTFDYEPKWKLEDGLKMVASSYTHD